MEDDATIEAAVSYALVFLEFETPHAMPTYQYLEKDPWLL